MRILFGVLQSEPSPGPRYRVLQFLPTLERAGFECEVMAAQGLQSTATSLNSVTLGTAARAAHWSRAWTENQAFLARLLRILPDFDRVVLYRIPIPSWAEPLLKPHRRKLLYDYDDALDAVPEEGSWLEKLRGRVWGAALARAVRCCHIITTSNDRNAHVVRTLGGRAEILPTCVDVHRYAPGVSHGDRDRTVLGWIGTPSTAPYLGAIEGPLMKVNGTARLEIRLVGAGNNPLRTLDVTLRPWHLDSEVQETLAFDIGLMPMPRTDWSRGKAALKALQYGAAGLPTVASWTETNEQILGTDVGTVLCRTDDEWAEALQRLISDPQLRMRLGARGRARVTDHYSIEAVAPRLIELLRE